MSRVDASLRVGWSLLLGCALAGDWAKIWPLELAGSLGLLGWGLLVTADFRGSADALTDLVPSTSVSLFGSRFMGVLASIVGVLGSIEATTHM